MRTDPPRGLHADVPPYRTHKLDAGDGHCLWVSESGSPTGVAALVLHGGPGSGCSPLLRRFFDPARFRIVCIDQRGAGRSTPRGGTLHNTTAHLLADLRRLRNTLEIERWLVVGGSWGATLALAHALDEPTAVCALLLRAPFLARPDDVAAFFEGAAFVQGHAADRPAPRDAAAGTALQTGLDSLAARLSHTDASVRRDCALAWWRHEQQLSNPAMPPDAQPPDLDAQVDRYRVQAHYLRHGCWLQQPPLLARCAGVPRVPTLILQGREDRVCPPAGAHALQRVLQRAALRLIDGAGHDPAHPAMVDAMVRALDAFAAAGSFDGALQAGLDEAARCA